MYEQTSPVPSAQLYKDNDVPQTTASGAMTSGSLPPLELVPLSLDMAVARRMQKGLDKGYPRGNWMKGLDDPDFIRDRMRHFRAHLGWLMTWGQGGQAAAWKAGDDLQATVDAVAWGAAFMAEASENYMPAFAMAMTGENLKGDESAEQATELVYHGPISPNISVTGGLHPPFFPQGARQYVKYADNGSELVGSSTPDLRG